MSETIADMCRLTIVADKRRAALALPSDVRLVALLPTVLSLLGSELADAGLGHDGWILQRAGGGPLDDERTLTELGLLDGETLYLRPRLDALPEIDFDDLIDGIATGIRARSDPWRPAITGRVLIGFAAGALALAVLPLLLSGPVTDRLASSAALAALLLIAAIASSRALGESTLSALFSGTSVLYATVAGALVPSQQHYAADLGGSRLLCAAAGGTAVAFVALIAARAAVPALVALSVLGTAATIAGLLAVAWTMPIAHACALVVLLAVVFALSIPLAAFRLAGLHLPMIPVDREDLDRDVEPVPSRSALDSAALVDLYQSTLLAAAGVICAAGLTPVVLAGGWAPATFALTIAALLLLRARVFTGIRQRLTMLASGAYVIALFGAVRMAAIAPAHRAVLGCALAFGAAFVFAVLARAVPGRRMLPHWGRAADLGEYLAAIGALPLLLTFIGVLHWARSIAG
ncbi:type VII secretion integral membrane protein EccD [Catenulispora sp. NF23]|uniref:type VII secretion integral membrane protein EccD n=1 Tax=Catenulispora pinistramenti TaxID=2705254 RepID=UPI001BA7F0A4|nr:type VII secretion integral membrane protein EccD [Catenulispora pinistramenti]MBS2539228.1 type VII secretion integral membrane protein EccD [Catenulispora pinistramenti]